MTDTGYRIKCCVTQWQCNPLQHAATCCNTLQHAATRCNILILLFYDRHGLSDQVLRHAVAVLVEEEGREQVSFSNPFWERGMRNESCHTCRWVMSHGGVMSHTHIWRTYVSSKSRFRILFRSEVCVMSHVRRMQGSCHTDESCHAHIYEGQVYRASLVFESFLGARSFVLVKTRIYFGWRHKCRSSFFFWRCRWRVSVARLWFEVGRLRFDCCGQEPLTIRCINESCHAYQWVTPHIGTS